MTGSLTMNVSHVLLTEDFENRLIFDEVMNAWTLWACFLWTNRCQQL